MIFRDPYNNPHTHSPIGYSAHTHSHNIHPYGYSAHTHGALPQKFGEVFLTPLPPSQCIDRTHR